MLPSGFCTELPRSALVLRLLPMSVGASPGRRLGGRETLIDASALDVRRRMRLPPFVSSPPRVHAFAFMADASRIPSALGSDGRAPVQLARLAVDGVGSPGQCDNRFRSARAFRNHERSRRCRYRGIVGFFARMRSAH